MDFLYYVGSFIILLTAVVFFHELGHYLAAKQCGVKVVKFSIGMGPEIGGFTDKSGTKWIFSLFPIGGYVMMLGDSDIASTRADAEAIAKLSEQEKSMTVESKNNWQKMWISFCGPFANYIYAFIVLCGVFAFCGVPQQNNAVSSILSGSPAQVAGLQVGDVFVSVNNKEIKKPMQVASIINTSNLEYMECVVKRNGEEKSFKIKPEVKEETSILGNKKSRKQLGVVFGQTDYQKVSIITAIEKAFDECVNVTLSMAEMFKQLFTGKKSVDNLGGFVYIASITGDIAKTGDIVALIMFTVTLSLNLGFINLFPLPVVDGGNIVICLIEEIIRRPINKKLLNVILSFGVAILVLLMLFTTLNDILRLEFVKKMLSYIAG